MGDRHLVTIPQGVVGDRLPWGGERQGGGRVHTFEGVHYILLKFIWDKDKNCVSVSWLSKQMVHFG